MLLVQYGLGLWVNLKLAVPGSDSGAGFWSGFIDAITRGPVALSLHAILGTLLILSAVALVIRAVRLRSPMWTVLAAVGLVAILLAWITGVRFVVTADTEATLLMGLMTAVALFCFAVIVFTSTFADRSRR